MTTDKSFEINQPVAVKIDLDALTAAGASDHALEALLKENAREFARHVDSWMAEFKPVTPSEIQLIRHAASLAWKLDRADRYEEAAIAQRASDTILACLNSSHPRIEQAVALASFDPSSEADRIRRYRLAVHRELRKDLETFAKMRSQSEKRNPPSANGSKPADSVTAAVDNADRDVDVLGRTGDVARERRDPEVARHGSPAPAEIVDRRSPAPGREVVPAPRDLPIQPAPGQADLVAPTVNRPSNRRARRRPNLEQILKERKRTNDRPPEVPQYVKVGNWHLAETSLFSKRG